MARPYLVRVKELRDLVSVAVASQIYLLHRVELNGRHIYYVPFPAYDAHIIYYYEGRSKVEGRYVLLNKFTGDVLLSDEMANDNRLMVIPVVEVVEQDLLPRELTKKEKDKKRGRRSGKKK